MHEISNPKRGSAMNGGGGRAEENKETTAVTGAVWPSEASKTQGGGGDEL